MKAERKVFGRLQNVYDPPDLIEIQTKSYNDFLQEEHRNTAQWVTHSDMNTVFSARNS